MKEKKRACKDEGNANERKMSEQGGKQGGRQNGTQRTVHARSEMRKPRKGV